MARRSHCLPNTMTNQTASVLSTSMLDSLVGRVGGFDALLAYAADCYANAALDSDVSPVSEVITVAPVSGATIPA